jgi:hypothetical protein
MGRREKLLTSTQAQTDERLSIFFTSKICGDGRNTIILAMAFNGDVAVVNNFFYLLVFKREKNSLSTAYHLWHSRVLYKYALFYVVKSAWEN